MHNEPRLLDENCVVLKEIGKLVPYEVAVGMNGRVWVKSHHVKNTILIAKAIESSEGRKPNQIKSTVLSLKTLFQY